MSVSSARELATNPGWVSSQVRRAYAGFGGIERACCRCPLGIGVHGRASAMWLIADVKYKDISTVSQQSQLRATSAGWPGVDGSTARANTASASIGSDLPPDRDFGSGPSACGYPHHPLAGRQ